MRRLSCALLLLTAALVFLAAPGSSSARAATAGLRADGIAVALAPAPDPDAHQDHREHQAHMAYLASLPKAVTTAVRPGYATGGFPSYGTYSFSMLERVWVWAGGPSGVAWSAATIAECESGGRTWAKNPRSDATGLWQINGVPFPGNPWDGPTNARMAVAKFDAAHGFSPWVCQA